MSLIEINYLARRVMSETLNLGGELDKNDNPNNLRARNICNSINNDINKIIKLGYSINESLDDIYINIEGNTKSLDEFLFQVKMMNISLSRIGFNIFEIKYP